MLFRSERITWDEAYDIIEENIQGLKEKYGPESIVVFGGTGREGGPMCGPYGAAMIGTPNACYTQSGYACYIPRVAAGTYVAGVTYPEMDYHRRQGLAPRCRLIASWGWSRSQGYGCSPFKAVRELGSERRETVRSLSSVGAGESMEAAPSTRGPGWTHLR